MQAVVGRRALAHQRVLSWYRHSGRDLPWRHTSDPYRILVAEVMLQQTQVERVVPVYVAFLERFPTLLDLVQAVPGDVIRAWGPLGYNRRAVHLHALARRVVEERGGRIPARVEELLLLPGVGPYTAAAVACFAFGQDVPVVDTNIRRVLGRLFMGLAVPSRSQGDLSAVAQAVLPKGKASPWHQALMDLGAAICTARHPACARCPLEDLCLARPFLVAASDGAATLAKARDNGDGKPFGRALRLHSGQAQGRPFVGSRRYYRGRIVAALRGVNKGEALVLSALGCAIKPDFSPDDLPWLEGLLRELERDGLVSLQPHGKDAPLEGTTVALPARPPAESTSPPGV